MCRNSSPVAKASQSGFLIPLALVLLVGIAFLAIAINRITGQSHGSTIQQGLSAQALFAAESGAQYAMSRLFFNTADRAAVDAQCAALAAPGQTLSFGVTGLSACSAVVRCSVAADSGNTISFYTINSTAQCGGGQLIGEREIEVSATMQ